MESTEVVVIGGGPAGSVMGCYLAKAGVPTILLEKVEHPRPHVGESLVPSTTRIFEEIGFLSTMEEEGFVHKYGASWHSTGPGGQFDMWFREFPQPGIEQDYTYHVDRARFDHLLLKHAESSGVEVHQNAQVRKVHFEGDRAVGVTYREDGVEKRVDARCIVDASGRSCVLGNQLRWKEKDPLFDQFAAHTWFEGIRRGEGETADFIHIYFLPVERGWAWQIPITQEITSMGVVTDKKVFRSSKGQLPAWFHEIASTSPDLTRALEHAKPIRPFKSEADYSYCMREFTGDGFLLVGDAARFVDPIFSSGVSVACYSARFASEALIPALKNGSVTRESLASYESRLREGVEIWYEFIKLYYKLMLLFTHFITDPEYRHQILQLLQGEVYDRSAVPILEKMRKVIETVEKTPGHIWQPYLGDLEL